MHYRLIDHTADLGIEVWGADGPQLFARSALAMLELLCDPGRIVPTTTSQIEVTGVDWPDLMVNWLREVLYYWTGRQRLIGTVAVKQFNAHTLVAQVQWEPYNPQRHIIHHEIKAVTYHQIETGPGKTEAGKWRAKIIFDI